MTEGVESGTKSSLRISIVFMRGSKLMYLYIRDEKFKIGKRSDFGEFCKNFLITNL